VIPSRFAAWDFVSPRATWRISDMSRERSNKFSASTGGNPNSANRFPVRAAVAVRLLIGLSAAFIPSHLFVLTSNVRQRTTVDCRAFFSAGLDLEGSQAIATTAQLTVV
jgi:hypothetical protein